MGATLGLLALALIASLCEGTLVSDVAGGNREGPGATAGQAQGTRGERQLVADVSGAEGQGGAGGQPPKRKKAGGHKFMPGQLALLRKWRMQQIAAERQRQQQLRKQMQNGLTTPGAPLCSCNYRPQEECDFHFLGFSQQVPIIHMAGTNENLALTPPLRTYRRHGAVSVRVLRIGSLRAQTCLGVALGVSPQAHEQTSQRLQSLLHFPVLAQSRMFRRKMTRADMKDLENVCVKVPLAIVEVLDTRGGVLQLSEGDGNRAFPASRRCIAFKFAY